MDDELAYQQWVEREAAADRDPYVREAAFLEEEPPGREPGSTDSWTDDELVDRMLASQRRSNREYHERVLLTAELGRRRERAFANAAGRGVPTGIRPGGFPGEELAIELTVTRAEAGHLLADAADLTARLPRTLAAIEAGLIDQARAGLIAYYTRSLNSADTALADQILAEAAADLRFDQLAGKAARLEMKLNPEGVRARREQARRDRQRVESRREASGNASLSGREMDTATALASKAHLGAVARQLRVAGIPGSLGELEVLALGDLTAGRDPFARAADASPDVGLPDDVVPARDSLDSAGPAPADDLADSGPAPASDGPAAPAHPAGPAPLPALVNLLVSAGTLLGWSSAPAQADSWGLLDSDDTRTVVAAAAASPRTRWCVTLINPDGTAAAHGCANGPRHRLLDDLEPQPPPRQLAALIRRLNLSFTPVAYGSGDCAPAEEHYRPSRKLQPRPRPVGGL